MVFAIRAVALAAGLALGMGAARALAAPTSIPAIDRYARAFEAKAAAGKADGVFANFARDGTAYRRYPSDAAFARARAAFLAGPAPGGGSFVARTYSVAGARGCFVTFDPGVQNSLTERETILFDANGRALRLHAEVRSANGYYRTVRDAYFSGGIPLSDRTLRYEYAPDDVAFAHPLRAHRAALYEMTLPAYVLRAKLPFAAVAAPSASSARAIVSSSVASS